MDRKLHFVLFSLLVLNFTFGFSQRGKDGNYTVTALNTNVNSFTYLTADALAGAFSISVNNNAMSGGAFASNLAQGDLILIIQMQGATMDIDVTPTVSWGGNYTVPNSWITGTTSWNTQPWLWGQVTNYNNCGKFEQVEVRSVGTGTITLNCALQNSYTSSGHVQVVRVPRFNNLTLNASTSIMPTAWDGNVGGICAIEVNGTLTFNSSSKISSSGVGFRGGSTSSPTVQSGSPGTCSAHANGTGNGSTQMGCSASTEGGRKGEGIGGSNIEYAAQYSAHGRGAPANGGGGGGYQNCGGGGGANVGTGAYTGKGVPSTTVANAIWNLESAGFAGSASSGGGRGGYALSNSNQNAATVGPNNTSWCNSNNSSDARKENGGFGGHALTYDPNRLFFGGGGGAGDQDQAQAGSGGAGGGLVFLTVYGTISGSGTIEADGANGVNTNPNNTSPGWAQLKGNDGAGGAGAGGSIFIRNSNPLPTTLTLSAKGGNGGNQNITAGTGANMEAAGPGGAGAGGCIAFSSGAPVQNVSGGIAGTTNSSHLSEFNFNGATNGASGMSGLSATVYDIIPNNTNVCSGGEISFSVSVTGIPPSTVNWYSSAYGGSSLATGNTFTPSVAPTSTTTYYAGICPGTFRVPVTVTIYPKPTISGTPVLTNPSCSGPGSITGLSVSGGTTPYQYSWNGANSPSADLTNSPSGSYSLTVLDANGCTATNGPLTLTGTSGPIINSSSVAIQNVNCSGGLGSITGITATGNSLIYDWSNAGGSALNATSLPAGSYLLTVTDNIGCTSTSGPYTIGTDTGPVINETAATVTSASCGQSNGGISGITVSGSSLTYSWNGVATVSAALTNVSSGIYTLTVTDAGGCTVSSNQYTVSDGTGPIIDISSVLITNESCSGNDGAISGITVSGGSPSYTYNWVGTSQTTLNVTLLPSGTYTLTVTDALGCTATGSPIIVGSSGGPVIDESAAVVSNVQCNGSLGSISGISVSGTELTYSWSNSGGNNLNASGLVPNTYILTVTDGLGCTATSSSFTITSGTALVLNTSGMTVTPSSCASNTGAISGITIIGGVNPQSSWSSGQNTLDVSGLSAGNYILTVNDDEGCSASTTINVPSTGGLSVSITSQTNITCNGGNDGTISASVSGGAGDLVYSWSPSGGNELTATSLTAGAYTLTVTDVSGCVGSASATITQPSVLNASLNVTAADCGGSNGAISTTASGGNGTYTYAWSPSLGTSSSVSGLSAGSYTVTVIDALGCTVSATGSVVVLGSLDIVVSPSFAAIDEGQTVTLSVTGASTYSWTPSLGLSCSDCSSPIATPSQTTTYIITGSDETGCTGTTSITILVNEACDEIYVPTVFSPDSQNADQQNRMLCLYGNCISVMQYSVYDRWGNKVFQTSNTEECWDGTFNGQKLSAGVYVYKLNVTLTSGESVEESGNVTLIR